MDDSTKRVYLVVDREVWGLYLNVLSEIGGGVTATSDLTTYIQNVVAGEPAAVEKGLRRLNPSQRKNNK